MTIASMLSYSFLRSAERFVRRTMSGGRTTECNAKKVKIDKKLKSHRNVIEYSIRGRELKNWIPNGAER